MIQFEVVTIFPEMFRSFLEASLLGKAVAAGLVQVCFTDPRDHRGRDLHNPARG